VKTGPKVILKAHKASGAIILIVTLLVIVSLFEEPAFSASTLKCSTCHNSIYNQELKFLEENSQNIIPSIIQVGQILNVTVALENIDDASKYFLLSAVSVSLASKNNHFSVDSATYKIKTMAPGIATANWQITGKSPGSDEIIITATGINDHGNVFFSDQYSPNPSITIINTDSSTPTDTTPQPTHHPTNSPAQTNTPSPTPRIPELSSYVIPLLLFLIVVATVVLIYRKKQAKKSHFPMFSLRNALFFQGSDIRVRRNTF